MLRRSFLAGAAATTAGAAHAEPPAQDGWRAYTLVTEVALQAPAGPADLWLPIAASAPGPWQAAAPPQVETTGAAETVRDPRYRAAMLRVRWTAEGPRTVRVSQRIRTRDRTGGDGRTLSAAERALWLAPTASVPTDGIVAATARRIVGPETAPRAKLRRIYDWVVDSTFRDAAVRGCGTGDVKNMLDTGRMGGKCADINSLTVALCRASGIPARDVYGVRLGPSSAIKVLGPATPDVTKAQHCRLEAWLPAEGWFPLDPADVRKVVLDGKLAVDSPEVVAQRARLFGAWEMNWAAYNSATDVRLPGAAKTPDETFLMYPLAMTAKGELDQLDPASFKYTLTATATAAGTAG